MTASRPPPEAGRHDAFISYAREDRSAVARLRAALEARGKDVWLDVEDIVAGAQWEARITHGIEACTAFVFVMSADSLGSEHCRLELDQAAALNKLIIPVYRREVDEARLPAALAAREWIFLRDDDDFEAGVAALVEALETDLDWRDQHTRIAGATRDWLDAGHDTSFLLRGTELRECESWLARQADHREQATAEQAQFIVESRRAATARQRTLTGAAVGGLVIAVALAVFALVQRNDAIDQRDAAQSTQLAIEALAELGTDPGQSLVFGMRAYAKKHTLLSEGALRAAASEATPELILRGNQRILAPLAVAADGRHLAAAGSNGTVRVWDLRALRAAPVVLPGHRDGVFSVAFAGGDRLASSGADGRLRLWDWRARRTQPAVLPGEIGVALAVGAGGRLLASADPEGVVRVWDLTAPRAAPRLLRGGGNQGVINPVAFSGDGRYVASVGSRGETGSVATVRVWDLRARRPRPVVLGRQEPPIFGLAVAGDGRRVASAGVDGRIRVWDRRSPRSAPTVLRGHEGQATAVVFARDGRHLASGGADGAVRLWDWRAPRIAPIVLRGHEGTVGTLAFIGDGNRLASAGEDGSVRVWQWRATRPAPAALPVDALTGAMAFSSDGRHLASGGFDGGVNVWDAAAPRRGPVVLGPRASPVNGVAFARDGRHVAGATGNGTVQVWDWRAGGPPIVLKAGKQNVQSVAFSDDGLRVAAGDAGGTVRVWDWREPGTPHVELAKGRVELLEAVTFADEGRRVAAAAITGTVRVWDVRAPSSPRTVLRGVEDGASVTFAADGHHVATAGAAGIVRVWDWRTPRVAPTLLHGGGGAIGAVAFAGDGRHLASAGADGIVRIWDWRAPRFPPTLLSGHGEEVAAVAFAPDGRHLASASFEAGGRIWECQRCGDIDDVLALARKRVPREIGG